MDRNYIPADIEDKGETYKDLVRTYLSEESEISIHGAVDYVMKNKIRTDPRVDGYSIEPLLNEIQREAIV